MDGTGVYRRGSRNGFRGKSNKSAKMAYMCRYAAGLDGSAGCSDMELGATRPRFCAWRSGTTGSAGIFAWLWRGFGTAMEARMHLVLLRAAAGELGALWCD